VVQRGPEGHGARLTSCEHNLQLEPFLIWSGQLLGNRGGLVPGGMKIAGPIAACSADPPLDRWNGWVNFPLSSGMVKLGFSLTSTCTIRLETGVVELTGQEDQVQACRDRIVLIPHSNLHRPPSPHSPPKDPASPPYRHLLTGQ
jgi:hypothetical protein